MEKKNYVKPILNSEAFIPQTYIAACAQYSFRLMCSTNVNEKGSYDQKGMHGGSKEYDGNGNCTLTITEFGSQEVHGGIYNDDLRINGTLLEDYKSLREYFKNIEDNNQYIEKITWSTNGATDGLTYLHEGKLSFDRIAAPGTFS